MKSKIFKEEEFKILNSKEEKELTDTEKLAYYRELRNYYRNKKINYMGIRLREVFHPFLLGAIKLTRRDDLKVVSDMKTRPQGPVIYAVNHSNVHDVPYASEVIDEHYYLLAGNEVPDKASEFLFSLNGVVFVDRKNKESRANSKDELVNLLLHGKNIMMFPEGTWNLSPNQVMLPLNWGIIEVAQKTGCPIVPLILDYREGICYANAGEAMYVSPLADKKEQIELLREKMCTLRWEIWESMPPVPRSTFEEMKYDSYIEKWLKEYPKLDAGYESTIIYKNKNEDSPEEVFAPVKKLNINRNNAFLVGKYKK